MEVNDRNLRSPPPRPTYTFSRRPKRIIRISRPFRPDRHRSISINRRQPPLKSKKVIRTNFSDDSLLVRWNKLAINLPIFSCDFDRFHRRRVIHTHIHGMKFK